MNKKTQKDAADKTSLNMQNVEDSVTEIGDRIQTGMADLRDQMRSKLKELDVSEATIPDAFRKMPKFISPPVHAWLDLATTAYFVGIGSWFASRGKKAAAIAAFLNAGMVAGVSAMTDYDGSGKKPISFKLHGTLDAMQATTAAIAPVLHGFAGEPEAAFFYGQAANEVTVIASTDWEEGMPAQKQKRRKAA
jgi:hypothetical protein